MDRTPAEVEADAILLLLLVVAAAVFEIGLLMELWRARGVFLPLLACIDRSGDLDEEDPWAFTSEGKEGVEDRRVGLKKRRPRSKLLAIPFKPMRGEDGAGMVGEVDVEALLL